MEEMESNSIISCEYSDILLDCLFGAFEIVVIEIKSDKNISSMEFLDNSHRMTPESEGAIDHDIPSSRAQIEAVDILVVEYRDMSKTFFVQIVKK